jgi:hypothetical protein
MVFTYPTPKPLVTEVNHPSPVRAARRWVVRLLALCCLGLIPWIIELALTLPRHYLVANWPLAWTGFDVVLLGCLAVTAWGLWRQRQVAVPASMISCVLLLCDAWFDVLTAHGGRCLTVSVATAVLAELPIAVLLGLTSMRLLHASVATAGARRSGSSSPSLWRAPLLAVSDLTELPDHPHDEVRMQRAPTVYLGRRSEPEPVGRSAPR